MKTSIFRYKTDQDYEVSQLSFYPYHNSVLKGLRTKKQHIYYNMLYKLNLIV